MMEFIRLLTVDEVWRWYRMNVSTWGVTIATRHHDGTWEYRNVRDGQYYLESEVRRLMGWGPR